MGNLKDIWLVKLMDIEEDGKINNIHRYYRSKQPKESELLALIARHKTSLYELTSIINGEIKIEVYNNAPIRFKELVIDQGLFIGNGQVSEFSVTGFYKGQPLSHHMVYTKDNNYYNNEETPNDDSAKSLLNIIGHSLQSSVQRIITNILEDNNL